MGSTWPTKSDVSEGHQQLSMFEVACTDVRTRLQ
jgi:hypothetical protein